MIDATRLAPLTDGSGRLHVLALDHRDSLRVEFDGDRPHTVPVADLVRLKVDVVTGFGTRPTAVMLDPELSIEQVLGAGLLPAGVGSLCALEAQGYLGDPEARTNQLLEGWSPRRARDCGASTAKLLVLYRPDRGEATTAQDDLIRAEALQVVFPGVAVGSRGPDLDDQIAGVQLLATAGNDGSASRACSSIRVEPSRRSSGLFCKE